jgi:hypothetical protein
MSEKLFERTKHLIYFLNPQLGRIKEKSIGVKLEVY